MVAMVPVVRDLPAEVRGPQEAVGYLRKRARLAVETVNPRILCATHKADDIAQTLTWRKGTVSALEHTE